VRQLSSKLAPYRPILWVTLITQLGAVLLGAVLIYPCIADSPSLTHNVWNVLWRAVVVPPALMVVFVFPLTVAVIAVISFLIFSGLRWKRVWFLWVLGVLVWGLWWLFWVYAVCALNDD
jgi:hypothetical protein